MGATPFALCLFSSKAGPSAAFCWRRYWKLSNKDASFFFVNCFWPLCYNLIGLSFINLKIYANHWKTGNILQRYLWMGIYLVKLCIRRDCFYFQWFPWSMEKEKFRAFGSGWQFVKENSVSSLLQLLHYLWKYHHYYYYCNLKSFSSQKVDIQQCFHLFK